MRGIAVEDYIARRTFALFVKNAWHVIEPSSPFVDGKHIDAICQHLQAVSDGRIKRLLVNMPPRHAKSTLISVMWPVWTWLNAPSARFLCASYALSLAIRDNRKCRQLIQSQWFQSRYGNLFQLSGDQNVKGRFENTKMGYRLATSTGSAATGEGGDVLLVDDPHSIDEKNSDVTREATIDWFQNVWSSRMNNAQTSAMVVVGQRIHYRDVSGYILEDDGEEWVHLNLASEYEPVNKCITYLPGKTDVPFWEDWRKVEGELLWPARFPREVIESAKSRHGSLGFAALHQQRPVPSSGGAFKEQWFRYAEEYSEAYILEQVNDIKSILKSQCWTFITVDLAISSKQTADYTVFACWAVTPTNDLILFDLIRGHFDNPEQLRQLKILNARYRPDFFKIERVGYQLALIQQALAEGIPCKEYNPVRDKVSRASTPAIWMENGKIYFLKTLTHLHEIKTELLQFPRGAHDDVVDTVSMAADEVTMGRIPLQGDDEPVVYEPKARIDSLEEGKRKREQARSQVEQWQADPFRYMEECGGGMWDN